MLTSAALGDARADAVVLKYEEVRELLSNLTSRTTSTTEKERVQNFNPPAQVPKDWFVLLYPPKTKRFNVFPNVRYWFVLLHPPKTKRFQSYPKNSSTISFSHPRSDWGKNHPQVHRSVCLLHPVRSAKTNGFNVYP